MPLETDGDDIRSLLQGAVDGSITADTSTPTPAIDSDAPAIEAPAGETDAQKAERIRDEGGRFAKAPKPGRETLTAKPKVETPAIAPAGDQQQAKPALAPEIDKAGKHLERIPAPQSWNGAGKVEWDRMPRAVREQVAADYARLDGERAEIAPLKELIDVNRQLLVNEAGSVVEGHRQLMAFARMSVENPAQLIQTIARAKGVDLVALVNGQRQAPAQQQQANDPAAFIAQEVQRHLQPYVAHIQRTDQQQTQATVREVEAFAADPAHPFFNDVAQDIMRRLQTGEIPDGPPIQRLQQAYEAATWSSPTIRPHLLAASGEEANKRNAEEVANAKRALGASLTGSPVPGAASLNGASNPNASIREDLLAAMKQHGGTV